MAMAPGASHELTERVMTIQVGGSYVANHLALNPSRHDRVGGGARWPESLTQPLSRIPISLISGLGVDGQRRSGVGVAESGLGDLDVDSLVEQGRTRGVF